MYYRDGYVQKEYNRFQISIFRLFFGFLLFLFDFEYREFRISCFEIWVF